MIGESDTTYQYGRFSAPSRSLLESLGEGVPRGSGSRVPLLPTTLGPMALLVRY